tara:strand:+ start:224 stop:1549 length:1326 start_codon:yes stop_codon:yes gene_type:complete
MVAWSRPDEDDETEHRQKLQKRYRRLMAAIHHRRKLVVAALVCNGNGQGPQGKKARRQMTFSWTEHVGQLTEDEFKLRYRFTFEGFYQLLDKIRDDLLVHDLEQAAIAKWGRVVEPETKLAIALRYLAGGSPLDLRLIYAVSKSYVYDCVWLVVDAVNKAFKVDFPIDDLEALQELEAGWREKAHCAGWKGQVGAIDGVHFPMMGPRKNDVHDPQRYYVARKAEYALLCMAICNSKRQIIFYDISQAPTTHDSMAFAATSLGDRIKAGDLPAPFFLNGDAAFPLGNSMITPAGTPSMSDFDYHQSANRVAIECAFGMLVRRWAILWTKLQCRFDRRAPLIGACIRLHNLCIEQGQEMWCGATNNGLEQVQPRDWAIPPRMDKNGAPIDFLDIERGPRVRHGIHTYRRDQLAQVVAESGLRRPLLRKGIRKKVRKGRGRKGN